MYLESDHFLLFPILLMIDWPSSASLIWWYNTPLTAFSASNLSLNISRCQTDPARTGLPSWNLYSSIWARLCWGNKHHQNLSGLTQERLLLIQSFYLKVTTSPLLPFCWVCSCGHTGKVITLFDDLEELAIGGCLLTPTHWTACPCLMGIQVMMAPYLPDCPPFLTPQNLSYLPLFLHLTGQ